MPRRSNVTSWENKAGVRRNRATPGPPRRAPAGTGPLPTLRGHCGTGKRSGSASPRPAHCLPGGLHRLLARHQSPAYRERAGPRPP